MVKVNFPPILNGKTNIIIMKVIDKTKCKRPQTGEEFNLTVEHHAGSRYSYYGKTKKEATEKFKKKWGNFSGFVKKEWNIE
jgi:hypothetical protein